MRYFLLLVLSLYSLLAGAVEFDELVRQLPLGREMYVFEDMRGTASLEEILSPALDASFRRNDTAVLNAGFSRSVYWLRLDLKYQPRVDDQAQHWLLELAYPPLDHVDLYLPDGQGGFRLAQRTGDALPYSSRQIRQNNYVFELDLQPGQPQRVYLRLQSQGSMQAPLTLWAPNAYLEAQPDRIYLLGIIYGTLLVMLIYNLFIFVTVRDISYLYYILYIASFGLYQVSVNGAGIEYFWPDNPWWANVATPFLIGATALFGCQFSRSFLHTAEHSRWINRLLLAMMACGVAVMVLALTASYSLSLRLATSLALLFSVSIFTAGIVAWLRGMRVARYFIFAWTAFLAGGVINSLMVMGHLPNSFFTMYASQIGSALEVALLSLALADRINAMKEERAAILQQSSRELEKLNRELEVSNQLKDEFLSTVTHELRTPMNGVIGSLELMQTLPQSAELQQYQQTAENSARDMMRMVNDILLLGELQAGKLHAQPDTFSLRGMLEGLRARFTPQAADKHLQFILELDDRLPDTLEGDAAKLGQALGYLLDNAIKFTPSGSVTLRVEREEVLGRDPRLHISVLDTGIGFVTPPDDALYQRFKQLEGGMTRQYGGLGVGLAICRQLVGLIGGTLRHSSHPGQGSCFELTLALVEPKPEEPQLLVPRVPCVQPRRAPADCTVLVVEDNAINQVVTRGMLLKLGYRVRTANNGAEALALLREERVDAVLMDCQMPVMDGFATCRALRQLPGCADLPVLAVTAHSHAGDRERCLAAGMNDYTAKPVKFLELQDMLRDWLLCVDAPTAAGRV
jgi:signal transduction histidine kinase